MSTYGAAINIFQEKKTIQNELVDYYGDLVMTKGKIINATEFKPSYSLFYARIGCLLCIDDRYVIIIVENDPYKIGYQQQLSKLNWISFQTRIILDPPLKNLKSQQIPSKTGKVLNERVKINVKMKDKYVYLADISPIKIELLFNEETQHYAETGSLKSCLETYNCVVYFVI